MTAHDVMVEFRFSGFKLDSRQRKLFNPEGETVALSSRAFDTLFILLESRGETLSKSRIMQAVWPNVVVEENNLSQAISSLRKALGDTKSENNFILTVPGRGYCFVAPVEILPLSNSGAAEVVTGSVSEPDTSIAKPEILVAAKTRVPVLQLSAFLLLIVAGTALYLFRDTTPDKTTGAAISASTTAFKRAVPAAPAAEVIRNSIAVLPFTNLNPDGDNALFALGLHDEVINQLTKIRSLNVIARHSVVALAEQQQSIADIGRMLRVESMMSGTILFAGEQARISLQMLDAATGVTLWANTYEANKKDLAEMISIQSDIAVHVASALKAEVEQSEQETIAAIPTRSFKAYRYNLAARNAHYKQDYANEWDLSRQAVELDPTYFDALFTFASANTVMVATPLPGKSSHEHYQLALDSAERMIEIAPNRSAGYAMKAVALSTNKEWARVADVLDTLNSMNVPISELKYISLILMCLGDFDRAIEIYQASLITEPVDTYGRGFLIAAQELAGNREQSKLEFDIGEELSPVWWGDAVNIFLTLGRNEPLADIDELVGVSPELKNLLANINDPEIVKAGLDAFRLKANKFSTEALYYAAAAAYIGEDEIAVEMMRSTLDGVWTALFWFWLPVFDDTRQLESFRQVLSDSGMVDYWRQHGWPQVCQPVGDAFACDWKAYAL